MENHQGALALPDPYEVGTGRNSVALPNPSANRGGSRVSGRESRLRSSVLAATEEGIVITNRVGSVSDFNLAASRILGIELAAGTAASEWSEPLSACDALDDEPLEVGRRVMASGQEVRKVAVNVARDGIETRLSINYLPRRDERGAVDGLVLSLRDVDDRECERRTLLESRERLREAHDVAKLASWEWDPNDGDVVVFQALEESGMAPGSRVTLDEWLALIPADQQQDAKDDFAGFRSGARTESIRRFAHLLPTGPIWLEIRTRAVRNADGTLKCVRGTAQDVSEQEFARQDLAQTRDFLQATLDSLATHVVVLDAHGEIVMANRAWTDFALANGGTASAVGVGRNYLTVCDADEDDPSAAQAAAGLRSIIAGDATESSSEHSCDSPEMLRWFRMHAVVYDGAGPARVVVTHEDISQRKAEERLVAIDLDKLACVGRIEHALSNDRFVLQAQPILELATGQIVQHELLIRMRHPDGSEEPGLVPPSEFLPVAEEFGLIMEIDRWVIDRAAELAATGLPVELNISGRSLSDPRLVDHIKSAIERTGAAPSSMVFEITETTLVENDALARVFVAGLHALGCMIALDDFGTGYGGFTYLKQLPVDYLKIDVEFVTDLIHNPDSRTVVEAIVRLAHGFGLKTVAEGIEDGETLEALRQLGVHYVQGYHVGRPAAVPVSTVGEIKQ